MDRSRHELGLVLSERLLRVHAQQQATKRWQVSLARLQLAGGPATSPLMSCVFVSPGLILWRRADRTREIDSD